MTQDQLLILAFKIAIVAAAASIALFVLVYTMLAPWWRNELGKTLVYKDLLLEAILCVTIASLFFGFNRLTSRISLWIDVVVFAAMTPVMLWRCALWARFHVSPADTKLPWPQVWRLTAARSRAKMAAVWAWLTTSRRPRRHPGVQPGPEEDR